MITNIKKYSLCAAAIAMALPATSFAVMTTGNSDLCVGHGYTVGFFNGVANTVSNAADSRDKLRDIYGDEYNSEKIQYEVFYNTTQAESDSDPDIALDVAEVFLQRAAEIDASGELGRRWELFWESLPQQVQNRSLLDMVEGEYPEMNSLMSQLFTEVKAKIAAAIALKFTTPPTLSDYAAHNLRLDALSTQKQKLLLVAHSQGNLFMNQGYSHVLDAVGADSVKAVHIAPPSSTLHGDYVLANIDTVIDMLRTFDSNSVLPANLIMNPSPLDESGHGFSSTYLDSSRNGKKAVTDLMDVAFSTLQSPPTQGQDGAFTVTLQWDGAGDVDLHTYEPNGSHVYYNNDQGIVGQLDVDNTESYGPEHYFASCDSEVLEEGTYSIGINNYNNADGRKATIQVASSQDGVLLTTPAFDVGAEQGVTGDHSPIHVVDVQVTKEPADPAHPENGKTVYKYRVSNNGVAGS